MRVGGSLSGVQAVQPPAERRERAAALEAAEASDRAVELRRDPCELSRPRAVVEDAVRVGVGLQHETREDARERRQIVEVDAVGGVVLRVVQGPVVVVGEGGDVDPRNAGGEEGPDLGPRVRPVELPAMLKQTVALGPAADPLRPGSQLRRRVDDERIPEP